MYTIAAGDGSMMQAYVSISSGVVVYTVRDTSADVNYVYLYTAGSGQYSKALQS